MADATHRAEIVRLIETVDDGGLIHDYHRMASEWDKVLNFFKTTIGGEPVIRGWLVTCTGITPEGFVQTGAFSTGLRNSFNYSVRGFFGVDDETESEKTAFQKAREVQVALTSSTLFSAADGVIAVTLPALEFNHSEIGGVLCHHAEITFSIVERV
jgi:hypothetical protein